MGRSPRMDVGGHVYHVVNRANGRATLFAQDADYAAFERILESAVDRHAMRLLAYCLMPNHWHLVIWPRRDGDMARFVGWLTLTHTQRRHAHRRTVGCGHVYQGRYRSFPVDTEGYLVSVGRYVERNARRAGLVQRAERWRWGSLWRWLHGDAKASEAGLALLSGWPTPTGRRPRDWVGRVNEPQTEAELAALRRSAMRGTPLGDDAWVRRIIARHDLASTSRPRGRPRKADQANNGA